MSFQIQSAGSIPVFTTNASPYIFYKLPSDETILVESQSLLEMPETSNQVTNLLFNTFPKEAMSQRGIVTFDDVSSGRLMHPFCKTKTSDVALIAEDTDSFRVFKAVSVIGGNRGRWLNFQRSEYELGQRLQHENILLPREMASINVADLEQDSTVGVALPLLNGLNLNQVFKMIQILDAEQFVRDSDIKTEQERALNELSDDLKEELQSEVLTLVLSLMPQVASAIEYLQEQRLVHRDIKPANLILDITGDTVKLVLCDFEFCVEHFDNQGISLTGDLKVIAGTPAYLSPEQITGGRVDSRTDTRALAVVMHMLLSGDKPCEGLSLRDRREIYERLVEGDEFWELESTLARESGLGELIQRQLSIKPEDRLETDAFTASLRECVGRFSKSVVVKAA